MKIAVYHNVPPGGALRGLAAFRAILASRGHEIDLYTLENRDGIGETRRFGLSDPRLPLPRAARALARGPIAWALLGYNLSRYERWSERVAERIDAGGYDLAWVDGCEWTRVPPLLRFLRTPAVHYCHDPLEEGPARNRFQRAFHRRLDALQRKGLERARAVFTNSLFTQGKLRRRGIETRVVQTGLDLSRFRPLEPPRRENVIFLPGTAWPFRGQDVLVEALARVPAARNLQVLFTGEPGDPAYRDRVSDLARRGGISVAWHGAISDDDMIRHYQTALLVAYPSREEPLGLAPLEAQACGTPVVAAREGGIPETVRHGETGLLVPREPGAFADAITHLLGDPALRERMGRSGVQWIRERWSLESAAEVLETALGQAVGA